jgi:hypothetical protein
MTEGEQAVNPEVKPKRLYFETYLQMIENSIGSAQYRNFYVWTDERGTFDALDDGENSCAFFVSSLLTLMKVMQGVHGTVESTINELKDSGWRIIEDEADIKSGDVLVWEPQEFHDGMYEHIGFVAKDGQAVSTSWKERTVVKHDLYFGEANRAISQIFRKDSWD